MTIYKEMKYQKRLPEAEKLAEGKVGVYKWKVLSHWTHPCGYVSVPENHPFYGKNCSEIEGDIEVHGGLTFSGKMKDSDDYWFGWDYYSKVIPPNESLKKPGQFGFYQSKWIKVIEELEAAFEVSPLFHRPNKIGKPLKATFYAGTGERVIACVMPKIVRTIERDASIKACI